MQVIDALSRRRPGVRDQPKTALGYSLGPCHARGHFEEAAQQLGVVGMQLGGRPYVLARYQQDVRRRLGRHVAETDDELVLLDDVRRYLAPGYAAEQAVSGRHDADGSPAAQSCGLVDMRNPMMPTAPAMM